MHCLEDGQLKKLQEVLEHHVGTGHLKLRKNELAGSIANVAKEFGFSSYEVFLKSLLETGCSKTLDALAEHVTIGETYFFRHKKSFEVIRFDILPKLIERLKEDGRSELNFWCAGCSSGEEPYSLAIMLDKFNLLPAGCKVNIYASDINRGFLKKAESGIYSEWSFRELPDAYRRSYFKSFESKEFILEERIRKKVKFFKYNLLGNGLPDLPAGKIDMIFCRNVLIYFNDKQIEEVFKKFSLMLQDEGWLLTSPAEVTALPNTDFESVCCSGIYFFRKINRKTGKDERTFNLRQFFMSIPGMLKTVDKLPEKKVIPEPPVQTKALKEVSKKRSKKQLKPLPIKDNESVEINDDWLEKALDFDADLNSETAGELARRCADSGKIDLALHWSKIALEGDNLNPERHYFHAHILCEHGDVEEAQRELKRALFLKSDFISGYFSLGMLQLSNGRRKDGLKNLKNAEKMLANMPGEEPVIGSDGISAKNMLETISRMIA
jgi:chemotaxis protein methyltransferase CheR